MELVFLDLSEYYELGLAFRCSRAAVLFVSIDDRASSLWLLLDLSRWHLIRDLRILIRLFVSFNNCLKQGRLSTLRMPDDKAIEHEPPMLVSLPKDVSRFDHDGLHYVTHLPSDIPCVHEKLVSGFRILIEHFLPEAYPELDGDTLIELSLRPGIKREALVF